MKDIIILLLILYSPFLYTQNSFVKYFPDERFEFGTFVENTLISFDNHSKYKIITFDSIGNPLTSNIITIQDNSGAPLLLEGNWAELDVNKEQIVLGYTPVEVFPSKAILFFNTRTQKTWAKRVTYNNSDKNTPLFDENPVYFLNNSSVLAESFTKKPPTPAIDNYFELSKFSVVDGKKIWAYSYRRADNARLSNVLIDKARVSDNKTTLLFKTDVKYIEKYQSLLLQINDEGDMLQNILIDTTKETMVFTDLADSPNGSNGDTYVAGRIFTHPEWNSTNEQDGFIAKLDSNFKLVWAKRFVIDYFQFADINIGWTENNNIRFTLTTYDSNYPNIIGDIGADGELLSYHGFHFYHPYRGNNINNDGSVSYIAWEPFTSIIKRKFSVVKTNPEGYLEKCPTVDACLALEDFDIPFLTLDMVREPADTLEALQVAVEPYIIKLEDKCFTPIPPSPYFEFADTVCQGTIFKPTKLKSETANAAIWHITDPNGNLTSSEDLNGQFRFSHAGRYDIEQEIWVLGCSDFYTRTVEVLSRGMGLTLGKDTTICDSKPFSLTPKADRPLKTFKWQNRDTSSFQTISSSGTYSVTASDGFCTNGTSVEITFFDEWLGGANPLELPPDTTICKENFPFLLKPTSDFTSDFYIDDSEEPMPVFELNQQGSYHISALIHGCNLSQVYRLKEEECAIPIFIPNSFSPNGDETNDVIQPIGFEHTGLRLQIYDRWGGLIFETTEAPFAWDGNSSNGQPVEKGVYVLFFNYLNHRTGAQEWRSVDVSVVR